jgi:hypothetical protein
MSELQELEHRLTDALSARAAQVGEVAFSRPTQIGDEVHPVPEGATNVIELEPAIGRVDRRRRLQLVACVVVVVGLTAAVLARAADRHSDTTETRPTTSTTASPTTATSTPTTATPPRPTITPSSVTTVPAPTTSLADRRLTAAALVPASQLPAGPFWGGLWRLDHVTDPATTTHRPAEQSCDADFGHPVAPGAVADVQGTYYGPSTQPLDLTDRQVDEHLEQSATNAEAAVAESRWIAATEACTFVKFRQLPITTARSWPVVMFDNTAEAATNSNLPFVVAIGRVGRVTVEINVSIDAWNAPTSIDAATVQASMAAALDRVQAYLAGH